MVVSVTGKQGSDISIHVKGDVPLPSGINKGYSSAVSSIILNVYPVSLAFSTIHKDRSPLFPLKYRLGSVEGSLLLVSTSSERGVDREPLPFSPVPWKGQTSLLPCYPACQWSICEARNNILLKLHLGELKINYLTV